MRTCVMLLCVVGMLACDAPLERRDFGDSQAAVSDAAPSMPMPATPPAPESPSPELLARAQEGKVAIAMVASSTPMQFQERVPGMVIRTGTASIEVDSLQSAINALRSLSQRVGGYVANASVSSGREEMRAATIEIKVPAERFDDALTGLERLGTVESVQVSAQDVGEEYVDILARSENLGRLEERLLQLLATRTGKLDDVLKVERELARVREEIERMEGRLRYLRSRTSLSTLSVTVHEPAPFLRPGHNPIGQSVLQAWRNFVGVLAGLIAALGFVIPLAALIYGLVWAGRRIIRARLPRAPRANQDPAVAT